MSTEKKMGVLIVHGIGSQKKTFADSFIKELQKWIKKKRGCDPKDITFRPVHWSPVLDGKEKALWKNLKKGNELDWVKMRKFLIYSFGDAIAYNQRPRKETEPNKIYLGIHEKLHEQLVKLKEEDFNNQDKPVVLIGHSLGSHIISNYIWDRQHGYDPELFGDTPFEKLDTLTGIITFGSNIPLFTLALQEVEPIKITPPLLNENLEKVKWLNYYDSDDILGFPLKNLSDSYEEAVHKDIQINVGNVFVSWSPASHTKYWKDDSFTKPVAKFLCDILKVL